jgi:ATP-dependent Clp protease ATP-binding subunit ClpC
MSQNIYVKNKRLFFTPFQEFWYRLFSFSFYVAFVSSTFILILSPYKRASALGFLFLFFLGDRLLHFGKGEKSVFEIYREGGELSSTFTPKSLKILNTALNISKKGEKDFHLALLEELLAEKEIIVVLKRLDISPSEFLNDARAFIKINEEEKFNYEEVTIKMIFFAYENALKNNDLFIYPRNIFASLPNIADEDFKKFFNKYGITGEDLDTAVIFGKWKNAFESKFKIPHAVSEFARLYHFFNKKRVISRDWTSKPTPLLDQYSFDLTDLARRNKLGFLIGHKKEFEMLLDVLSRPLKPNALVLGEAGSGKTAIIDHLAYRIVQDDVPKVLFDKRLVSLRIDDLISGNNFEEISKRISNIIDEVVLAGNVILFIPNIHILFKPNPGGVNFIELLLPAIKDYSIPVIANTTPSDFKKYIERNSDFLEQFEIIRIQELTEEEAVRLLIYRAVLLERDYKIFIPFNVIRRAVYLGVRYFHTKPLPTCALELFERAVGKVIKENKKIITLEDLDQVAEENSSIPIQKAGEDEVAKLLNLENLIHKKFINQDAAVSSVARALREYRSGLSRKGGPIATFLFVGPTGVGKTELSKILAEIQFGSKNAMLRFDMSEFQDKLSIYKLIGQPDGSVGGTLTDAVFEHPYSLILLDEFEKAHPDVLNIFLQVFDDGRLTDSLGKTVNFENTIIIATSNANSDFIKEEIEKGQKVEEIASEVKKKLTNFFKPELLNRFSDIVVFRDLNKEEIKQIAGLLMNDLKKTLEEEKGIILIFDEDILNILADKGYDPVFGARPLRKVISEEIKSILAEDILRSKLERGDTLKIIFKDGKFVSVKI